MIDYEKAYKAALKTATQWIKDGCTDKEKICLECVFPELRESEDERIRKRIRLCLDECVHSDIIRDYERDECLAYLEKQKEPENISASTMVPSCWEVEQKEQKPAEWSEEDEERLERVDDLLWMLDDYVGDDCTICEERATRLREEIKNVLCPWLKSLRPVSKESLQPHWKPSEEQMKALLGAEGILRAGGHTYNAKVLASLYEQLKKP